MMKVEKEILNNIKEKNGFTLIELLAVIVILGILVFLAIPAVTRYIEDSKKKTYVSTINDLVDSLRYEITSGDSEYGVNPGEEKKVYFNEVKTEKGMLTKSPFGNFDQSASYILVERDNEGNYTYKVQSKDSGNYTIALTDINNLDFSDIKKFSELTLQEQSNFPVYRAYSIGDEIMYKGASWR